MYSPQFRERAVALIVDEDRRVGDVARDLGVTEATFLYRWKHQALVDCGKLLGTSTVESSQSRDVLVRMIESCWSRMQIVNGRL
ncbi:transposase [Nocardia sp. NPDC058640]